jgi:hypothetical protein
MRVTCSLARRIAFAWSAAALALGLSDNMCP